MKNYFMIGRFALVGVVSTSIHMLVVSQLITRDIAPALVANMIAFLTAFSFSFCGNYYWTFSRPGQRGRALRRFFMIAVGAFAVNTLLLVALLNAGWLSQISSALLAATVVPVISFLASRYWGFRKV